MNNKTLITARTFSIKVESDGINLEKIQTLLVAPKYLSRLRWADDNCNNYLWVQDCLVPEFQEISE